MDPPPAKRLKISSGESLDTKCQQDAIYLWLSQVPDPSAAELERAVWDENDEHLSSDGAQNRKPSDGDTQIVSEGELSMGRIQPGLCLMCSNIFERWSEVVRYNGYRFSHHSSMFLLEKSAEDGCALCTQLLLSSKELFEEQKVKRKAGTDFETKSGPISGTIRVVRMTASDRSDCFELQVHYSAVFPKQTKDLSSRGGECMDGDNESEVSSNSFILDVNDSESKYWFHAELVPSSLDRPPEVTTHASLNTKDALPLARKWFGICRQLHPVCKPPQPRTNPTRLISIRAPIRLCVSNDLQGTPEYATLSHCWGDIDFTTLEQSTLQMFQESLPLAVLTKTFKDAIHICSELGINYLWIDSFCIIQDDFEDWKRESSLMANVYGQASVNIAADGAPNGTYGCFFDRKSTWSCQVSTESEAGKKVSYDCVPSRFPYLCLVDQPLRSRGWAVQEHLLPPRTLHFTSTQVTWECHRSLACEAFPTGLHVGLSHGHLYYGRKHPITREYWEDIIRVYSRCHLTKSMDKLEAISGLAQHIQQQTKDDYLAGLWRKGLEQQMCWHAFPDQGRDRAIPQYRAPSWSWASTDAEVFFPSRYLDDSLRNKAIQIRVLKAEAIPSGENHLGGVSDGIIQLACKNLYNLFVIDEENCIVGGRESRLYAYWDHKFECQGDLCLMPVSTDGRKYVNGEGLLLQSANTTPGQYRRVGFSIGWSYDSESFWQNNTDRSLLEADDSAYMEITYSKRYREGIIEIL